MTCKLSAYTDSETNVWGKCFPILLTFQNQDVYIVVETIGDNRFQLFTLSIELYFKAVVTFLQCNLQ